MIFLGKCTRKCITPRKGSSEASAKWKEGRPGKINQLIVDIENESRPEGTTWKFSFNWIVDWLSFGKGVGVFLFVEIFRLVEITSLLHVIVKLEEKSYWKRLIFDLIN